MAYQPWFKRRPELLERELGAFKNQQLNFHLDEEKRDKENIIIFRGEVNINDKSITIDLIYPSEFPAFPIVVVAPNTNIARHQNPFDKNLCVIPHNQDGWESGMTGAYMVEQATRLFQDSEQGADTVKANEVDAPEPWSNYLQYKLIPLYIIEELPKTLPETGRFEIKVYLGHYQMQDFDSHPNLGYYHVLETLSYQGGAHHFKKNFYFQEQKSQDSITGHWFKLSDVPNFNLYDPDSLLKVLEEKFPKMNQTIYQLRQQIKRYRKAKPKEQKSLPRPHLALLFPEENYERGNYRTTFLWGILTPEGDKFIWSEPQFFSIDEHFKRIPELKPVYYESVLIVGLGSLGSAVAIELGKSGVGSQILLDYDSLDNGNLVRHTGNLSYLGLPKSKVLEHQIRAHFPFAEVETIHLALGRIDLNLRNDGKFDELYERMKDASLVINTTAEKGITRILDRLAVEVDVPIIHSWVTNGAWGGRIIRTRPKESGCYYCFSNGRHRDIASSPVGEIYPGGCGFPTFTGPSYNIYEIATHTVRLALDTLLQRQPKFDHIIVEHDPPVVETFPIEQKPDCPICGGS